MDIVAISELDNRGTGDEFGIRSTWCAPSIEKPCSVTKSKPRITSDDEGSMTIKLCTIDGIFGKSIERQTTPTTERVSEFTADNERLRGAGKISTARRSAKRRLTTDNDAPLSTRARHDIPDTHTGTRQSRG